MLSTVSWKVIDTYFKENPYNLVAHHLDSYDDFFRKGINNIFRENNPVRFMERSDDDNETNRKDAEQRNQCSLYLGGKNGDRIYFGKPIIYDDSDKGAHYMYPNDARLRNMTYGITVHYDVDVEFTFYADDSRRDETTRLEKIYLGRFPIMLQSSLCLLRDLPRQIRYNMGECKNDYGGYFIIDGKEKVIVPQEKFADNILYIKKNKEDDLYSISAEIRSVSEDASKPVRTMAVKLLAPSSSLSNNQLLVTVPNVRKAVPLFILMRALGVVSDKAIIEHCLLDLDKNAQYIDMFIPSVHDAGHIFNQETALRYIASFTKRRTITGVLDILMNYFLPHLGEKNFLDKAYFVGYMTFRLLRVWRGDDKPTDRDNYKFKRVETSGTLLYDLFREYYLIQLRDISQKIDKEYYFHTGKYKTAFMDLVNDNVTHFFKDRVVESGFRKAFKGSWGSESHTKRVGVVQDLNRLSWNSFMSQLRKLNLPLDASAKVVGPRLLNSSQWGFIDPIDTPDGGNIGLHKHLAISTIITSGCSAWPMIRWLRANANIRLLQECNPEFLGRISKLFVNGIWVGGVEEPLSLIHNLRLYRRNGLIPPYTSVSFDYEKNEVTLYTDGGRLTRPLYYVDRGQDVDTTGTSESSTKSGNSENSKPSRRKTSRPGTASFERKDVIDNIDRWTWSNMVCGLKAKTGDPDNFSYRANTIYEVQSLYPDLTTPEEQEMQLTRFQSVIEYVDASEEEGLLVASDLDDIRKNRFYTNLEIDPSLMLGVMGNQIIFPENNPVTRNAFSCGQSKQAVSVYHTNYQMRIDKMGVVLNNGQIPLVKSRYLEYINNEEQPCGVNAIVAIMSYTGYNVEDAILINEGAVNRGIFNTTYYSMYEAREESSKVNGSTTNAYFTDVATKNVKGIKPGYDYSQLDQYGLIRENVALNDQMVVIGRVTSSSENAELVVDSSVFPKKGQLGHVDKSFLTEGEEGFRIAKIRVREERLPAIGDKMASRAGQKGTLGLIIPEEDMPFCADGLRPDLIINPHAIPSRMTIGQLIESLLGKLCVSYGGFGDCTAFQTKGPNTTVYGEALVRAGYHSSGNQILYNGMTGEQLYSEIYIGPTYYMRLKHMVKDKINYRARGPNTQLTRQAVQGRANDGGLRIGEMERDGVMAHGASAFLNDSFMVRGDEYFMAVCNTTGCTAIYNETRNLFLSPLADGPVTFSGTVDGKLNIDNISRFGRSFSVVRIPFSLKLLIQELQVMNIQMRIITENNIDQLKSMSYSDNVNKLLKKDTAASDMAQLIAKYKADIQKALQQERADKQSKRNTEREMDARETPPTPPSVDSESTIAYAEGSPAYNPTELETQNAAESESPLFSPSGEAIRYPSSDEVAPIVQKPISPSESPPVMTGGKPLIVSNPELATQFNSLGQADQQLLQQLIEEKRGKLMNGGVGAQPGKSVSGASVSDASVSDATSVLDVQEPPPSDDKENAAESSEGNQNGGDTKKIIAL
jgi:DNA-directed RNA polymerase II subunit RPB2